MIKSYSQDTIAALATPNGTSSIGVIRISGPDTFAVCESIFKGKSILNASSHSANYGSIMDGSEEIDQVVLTIFKSPTSYTGEDIAEISCHGSPFIIKKILQLLVLQGVKHAKPGEFTLRAFLNGKLDLAQAESVADIIASDSEASHSAALSQMRGGFSKDIKRLREELINFASLIELELDFGEEDVEFADRKRLIELVTGIKRVVDQLIQSFDYGNVIKNGVPVVIVGKPNAGKSTLLNALLNEEKAMVSEIPGTTRDFIEDEITIEGINFRFVDTAGLRETVDKLESMGIERTKAKMKQASLIIYLFDVNTTSEKDLIDSIDEIKQLEIPYLIIGNKIDVKSKKINAFKNFDGILYISAIHKAGLEELKSKLLEAINIENFKSGSTIVTNIRHFESLTKTSQSLSRVFVAIQTQLTGDFLAQDLRQALHYLGEITGEITTEDLLENIFSKFCIGK